MTVHTYFEHDHQLTPEIRLALAVLYQAARDAAAGMSKAREFIRSDNFDYWCECIDADPDRLRRVMLSVVVVPSRRSI